ncbi:FtsQ-type POTRA domain-containing protein [Tissierella sp.]|uniref:cell division protein FtsQ/DivIB n=1 Tax=Tissierella sp. TaxID=41274 RepID=UPI00285BCE9C|nr:FtsQ-type POTRA domain-containing protein [Tissierella sp.]MDR7857191.1 FtsQ-type POTRA domain-containing protein [Tissierella sp.]
MKKLSRVEKKMRRRRFLFRLLLLMALIVTMFVLALNTDFFIIDNIKVLGSNKTSKDIIISASSITIGENQFKISTSDGEKNIDKIPYVKEVKIKRKFPKGIIIEIIERKELFQIKELSSFALIDIDGYILDIVSTENHILPLINGYDIGDNKVGDNIFSEEENKGIIDFILEGNNLSLLGKMKSIDLVDTNNVNFLLNESIIVAFGTLDDVKYKLNLLNEILKDIEKKQISCKMILMNKGDNPIIVLNDSEEG